jgi:hypothetical protein
MNWPGSDNLFGYYAYGAGGELISMTYLPAYDANNGKSTLKSVLNHTF